MPCMVLLGITVTGWGVFAPLCPWDELGLMATWTGFHGRIFRAGVSVVYSPHANYSFSGWEMIAFELGKQTRAGFLLPCPGESQGSQTPLHPQGGWCTLGKVMWGGIMLRTGIGLIYGAFAASTFLINPFPSLTWTPKTFPQKFIICPKQHSMWVTELWDHP